MARYPCVQRPASILMLQFAPLRQTRVCQAWVMSAYGLPRRLNGAPTTKTSQMLIAVTEAGAKAAELSGGMSLVSSEFVTALLTGIAGVVSTALVYFKMKGKQGEGKAEAQTVKIKRPIDSDDIYVTKGECQQHRCAISKQMDAMDKRIDEVGPALNRIFLKLNENDKKSEERTIRLHDRLEPIIQKVAATGAVVEFLKQERFKDEKRKS